MHEGVTGSIANPKFGAPFWTELGREIERMLLAHKKEQIKRQTGYE